MKTPKKAAMPVNTPKIRPSPTASSPKVMRYDQKTGCGSTNVCKKLAYQPCTFACCPVDCAMAPLAKPVMAAPVCVVKTHGVDCLPNVPKSIEVPVSFSNPAANQA